CASARNSEAMPQCAPASPKHAVMRVFVVIACVMALTGCSGLTYVQVAPQTANGRKMGQPKSATPPVHRSRIVSQLAKPAKPGEPTPLTPTPSPAGALLIPQPEPITETTNSRVEGPKKPDYGGHFYRHAEMTGRARLEFLKGSVNKTINPVRSGERSEP